MELDFPDFNIPAGPYWRPDDCGCDHGACAPSGLVLGTELGLALEDCDGVQVEITL